MATSSITSAQVGTAVVTGAGSLKGLAITMPIAANADPNTQLCLVDGTAANPTAKVLYSGFLSDFTAFLYSVKPSSVPVTPGGPTSPPAGTLFMTAIIPFALGLFVRSCPANMTFTATT